MRKEPGRKSCWWKQRQQHQRQQQAILERGILTAACPSRSAPAMRASAAVSPPLKGVVPAGG